MKTTTIIVRIFLGLLFLFSSVSFFLKLQPEPISNDYFKAFQIGLFASSYLIPLTKSVEFLCALAFISGRFVALANITIFPVSLNILMINYFLTPEFLPLAIIIFNGNIFLIYRYWSNYKRLFTI